MKIIENLSSISATECSVQIIECIIVLLMAGVILKITNEFMIYSRVQISMRRSTTDDCFWKVDKIFIKIVKGQKWWGTVYVYIGFQKYRIYTKIYGSLARKTGWRFIGRLTYEAVWAPHGRFGPAPIDALDQKQIENDWNRKFKCPSVSLKF